MKLPGMHLIVVNSAKAAFDLFDKRSAIYSSRVQHIQRNINFVKSRSSRCISAPPAYRSRPVSLDLFTASDRL
jgi:hypothetical protein